MIDERLQLRSVRSFGGPAGLVNRSSSSTVRETHTRVRLHRRRSTCKSSPGLFSKLLLLLLQRCGHDNVADSELRKGSVWLPSYQPVERRNETLFHETVSLAPAPLLYLGCPTLAASVHIV